MYDGTLMPLGLRQAPAGRHSLPLVNVMIESDPAPPNAYPAYPLGLIVKVLADGLAVPK